MSRAPEASLCLSLSPGAILEREAGGLRICSANGSLPLGVLPDGVVSALELLAGGGAPEDVLAEQAARAGGVGGEATLHHVLARLARLGLLHHVVREPGGELARLEPTSLLFELAPGEPGPDQALRLSRFAYLRRDGERLLLESPRAHARVSLRGEALLLLSALAAPISPRAAVAGLSPPLRPAALALVGLLSRAGLAVEADEEGATREEREPSLALWEFHDLLFHVRSRRRQHGQPIGATYRLAGAVAPLPAVGEPSGPPVALARPDLARLVRTDPPLAEVMERRRSIREAGEVPLTVDQLGELLYRCARVRQVLPGERDEISNRPYPSGGARYPLELYASVRACRGLEPGLYHYHPGEHRLERRSGMTPAVKGLLANSALQSGPPQVLLTLAARFPRVSWKYQSIAYTLILKEAGVLLQSLCLAATAMGLASCVLGHGDPDAFERAASVDGLVESSVAELAVGSLPTEEGAR